MAQLKRRVSLPEWPVHWLVWTGCVGYCLYRFALVSNELYPQLHPNDFEDGWPIIGKKKDVSDTEWQTIKYVCITYGWWFIGHVLLCQLAIVKCPEYRPFFHTIYGQLCVWHILGPYALLCLNTLVCLLFLIHKRGNRLLCTLITMILMLTFLHPVVVSFRGTLVQGVYEWILFEVVVVWVNARALSFALDRIESHVHTQVSIADLLQVWGYCFYVPTVFTGPLCLFSDYSSQMKNTQGSNWSFKSLQRCVLKALRLVGVFILLEVFSHFIYSTAVQYYINFIQNFSAWELCGLGYALPCQFYLKYLFIYGFAGFLSELEGIQVPPPPKCISREHLCSRLWRYIYKPLVGNQWNIPRRMFAGAISFAFVAVWHGLTKTICTWCFLNFLGVSLEMAGPLICSTSSFKRFMEACLSENMFRRLCALVATPLFLMMCISCLFFLSNWEVGIYTVHRFSSGFPVPLLPTLFFMYCGSHVSLDVREQEEKVENGRKEK